MPLLSHPEFKKVSDTNFPLWRYLTLPKFLSLIQTQSLYLSNLELLSQDDPFEGTLPPSKFIHREWNTFEDLPTEYKERIKGFMKPEENDLKVGFVKLKQLAELRIRQAYAYRRSFFINCWHLNKDESVAMWNLYSKDDAGIAIVASEYTIQEAFKKSDINLYGGRVSYGDYSDESFLISDDNCFSPVMHKRINFSHEQEYRLVHWDTSVTSKQLYSDNGLFNHDGQVFLIPHSRSITVGKSEEEIEKSTPKVGISISCDLNILIKEIYISPDSPPWFSEIIKVACKTYGLNSPILHSKISKKPLR